MAPNLARSVAPVLLSLRVGDWSHLPSAYTVASGRRKGAARARLKIADDDAAAPSYFHAGWSRRAAGTTDVKIATPMVVMGPMVRHGSLTKRGRRERVRWL